MTKYSLPAMTRRLLRLAAPVKGKLAVSTLASIVGNLAQMGLMGFGALTLLACDGRLPSPALWGTAMAVSAALIVLCRYVEGVVSHAGAYHLLAHLRVRLYEKLRAPLPRLPGGPAEGGHPEHRRGGHRDHRVLLRPHHRAHVHGDPAALRHPGAGPVL